MGNSLNARTFQISQHGACGTYRCRKKNCFVSSKKRSFALSGAGVEGNPPSVPPLHSVFTTSVLACWVVETGSPWVLGGALHTADAQAVLTSEAALDSGAMLVSDAWAL